MWVLASSRRQASWYRPVHTHGCLRNVGDLGSVCVRGVVSPLAVVAAGATRGSIVAQQGPKGIRLADITWQQAADVLQPETVVVIPLGAGSKEHGPHLKLGTDALLADYLARRVLDASDVVVAPTLAYHFFPAFTEYPGSTTLTLQTAGAATSEAAASLSKYGPAGSTCSTRDLDQACARLSAARTLAAQGILLWSTDLAARLDRASVRCPAEEGGTHSTKLKVDDPLHRTPRFGRPRRAGEGIQPVAGPSLLWTRRAVVRSHSQRAACGDHSGHAREGRVIVEALVKAVPRRSKPFGAKTPPAGALSPPVHGARPSAAGAASGGVRRRSCLPAHERTIRSFGDAFTLHWNTQRCRESGNALVLSREICAPGRAHGTWPRNDSLETARRCFLRREYRGSNIPLRKSAISVCVTADTAVATA